MSSISLATVISAGMAMGGQGEAVLGIVLGIWGRGTLFALMGRNPRVAGLKKKLTHKRGDLKYGMRQLVMAQYLDSEFPETTCLGFHLF